MSPLAKATLPETLFAVPGMRCAGCISKIETGLTQVPGIAAARVNKAWPFQEAQRLLKRYPDGKPGGVPVLFETGYGPSGLPHIGTFGEVARTTMIRRAFEVISDIPTRLICFSDDVDGMRKVPENVPQQDMLRQGLMRQSQPLSAISDTTALRLNEGQP